MFGCLQDAITYGEWYNGYGTAGMGNAASSFCMKVGSGVGTAALGWILNAGGFDAAKDVQSASSLHAVTTAFVWVPIVLLLSVWSVCCCLIWTNIMTRLWQIWHRGNPESIRNRIRVGEKFDERGIAVWCGLLCGIYAI